MSEIRPQKDLAEEAIGDVASAMEGAGLNSAGTAGLSAATALQASSHVGTSESVGGNLAQTMRPAFSGSAAPGATVKITPKAVNENISAARNPYRAVNDNVFQGANALAVSAPLTTTERVAGALTVVQRTGSSWLWMPGWMTLPGLGIPAPLPVAGALAWIMTKAANGAERIGWKSGAKSFMSVPTAINMALEPFHALHRIKIAQAAEFPGAAMRGMAGIARNGDHYLHRSAASLEQAAQKVDTRLTGMTNGLGARVEARVASFADRAGASASGRNISDASAGLFRRRFQRAGVAATTLSNAAHASLTQEPVGLLGRVKNFILRRTPATVAMPAEFAGIAGHLDAARGASGVMRLEALQQAQHSILNLKEQGSITGAVAEHLDALEGKVGKALRIAQKHVALGEVVEKGIAAWIKNAGHAVGRASLFQAGIAATVAAGVTAAGLIAGKRHHDANKALREFAEDIGDANSPLVQAAKSKNRVNAAGRAAGVALEGVSDALMLHGDVQSVIMPQMAMGMAGGTLAGLENTLLAAHQALKHGQLNAQQRLEALQVLVGTIPEVAANGGAYNIGGRMLAAKLNEKMESGEFSLRDVMHTLNNKPAYVNLTAQAKAEAEAKTAAAKAATAAEQPLKTEALPTPHTMKTAAPSTIVTANENGIQHQGRLSQQHAKAVG